LSDDWEDVRAIAYPVMSKVYPVEDSEADDHLSDAPALLQLLYGRIKVEALLLGNLDLQRDVRLRTSHYVFARIVRLGVFLFKRHKREESDSFDDAYRDQLKTLLDVDEETFARIFILGRRLAIYIGSQAAELSEGSRRAVRKFARTNLHNCKYCGTPLNFEKESKADNAFEIEHLFAQSLGGTSHKSNLAASCNRCNKIKDDKLSFVDFYYETFSLVTDDKENVVPHRLPHVILAIIMRQQGKCFHCTRDFYALAPESITLSRLEFDDYYHFRNCYVACQPCATRLSIDGINVEIPIPKG